MCQESRPSSGVMPDLLVSQLTSTDHHMYERLKVARSQTSLKYVQAIDNKIVF